MYSDLIESASVITSNLEAINMAVAPNSCKFSLEMVFLDRYKSTSFTERYKVSW